MSDEMTSYGKQFVNFSQELGAAGSKIDGLNTRIQRLEHSDVKINDEIADAKSRLGSIETRLGTVEKQAEDSRLKVDRLDGNANEQKGYWHGVKDSARVIQWAFGLLLAGFGALVMFLLQKIFV